MMERRLLSLPCIQKRIKPDTRLNILLFGCSGVGKSCFLNTIDTSENILPVRLSERAKTREFDVMRTCTVKYHQYTIGKNVRVFDTLGWTPKENYTGQEFELMLMGRVPKNSECTGIIPSEADDERIIDVVIFVLDGKSGVTDEVVNGMKFFVDIAREKKKKIGVVVTKMDEVVSFDEDNPPSIVDQNRIITLGSKFRNHQRKIGPVLKLNKIFPIINYTHLDNRENELIMLLKEPIMTWLHPIEIEEISEPLSLTKNEEPTTFRFPRSLPSSFDLSKYEERIFQQDPRGVILSPESLFHSIKLGDRKYRLFVVKSFICCDFDIIGVIEDQCRIYFEGTIERKKDIEKMLIESFGPNRVPEYVFLSDRPRSFTKYNDDVEFLLLDLKISRLGKILLKKKGFGMFQMMIENQNQMKKFLSKFEQSDTQKRKIEGLEENQSKYENMFQSQQQTIQVLQQKLDKSETVIQSLEEKYEELKRTLIEDRRSCGENCKERLDEREVIIEQKMVEKMEEYHQQKEEQEKLRRIEEEEELKRELEEERNKSKILSIEQYESLNRINGFSPTTFRLLFRGSEDGFKSSDFHRKCDNINGTFTIALTEQGNVLGGWNPVKWNQVNNDYYKAIGAWIFGFENDKKTIIRIKYDGYKNYGICCSSHHGPIFGDGCCISDDCNLKKKGRTQLDYGGYRLGYPDPGKGKHCLNGGTYKFKVLDYEVFAKI